MIIIPTWYMLTMCAKIFTLQKQNKTKPKNQSNLRLLGAILRPIVLSVEVNNAVILGSSFFLRSEQCLWLESSKWTWHQELFRRCLRERFTGLQT